MQNRIVLISDDSDFFEYILPKIRLRKSDELFRFSFDDVPSHLDLIENSFVVVNCENSEDKTEEFLDLIKGSPVLVFALNDSEELRAKFCHRGAFGLITMTSSDETVESMILAGLRTNDLMLKNKQYRGILVQNNLISEHNEVFSDCNNIIEKELREAENNKEPFVFMAISPNEKSKFLLRPNAIETMILNNIRQSDVLLNFAPNKYFLILKNTDIENAERIWSKIRDTVSEKIYAGFVFGGGKSREYIVNEALTKLHESINRESILYAASSPKDAVHGNFKIYRKEFNKHFEKIVSPVFYHIEQKYGEKYYGINIEHQVSNGKGIMRIRNNFYEGSFCVTSPGCSKINIDVTYADIREQIYKKNTKETKRIALEPEEFESGVLEDLLEQFISEFKNEVANDIK